LVVGSEAVGKRTTSYEGPLFDAMAQIDERLFDDAPAYLADARAADVRKIALFAQSRTYLGEDEADVLMGRALYRDLLVLGSPKYVLMDGDLDPDYIAATLDGIPEHVYFLIGEIMYAHPETVLGRPEAYIDPLASGTDALLRGNQDGSRVPVIVHWAFHRWERDGPDFHQLFRTFPKQAFIIPHLGFGHPWQVETILKRHPNVNFTLSKREVDDVDYARPEDIATAGPGLVDEDGTLRAEWKRLLERYSNRMLFATGVDEPSRWPLYGDIVADMRAILGQLPPGLALQIAYKNAERLYGVDLDDPGPGLPPPPPDLEFLPLEFPFEDPGVIERMAAFGIPDWSGTEPHNGTDLIISESGPPARLVSPTAGTITAIQTSENPFSVPPGQLILSIEIRVNSEWSVGFAVEPGTVDDALTAAQVAAVAVVVGQEVAVGDHVADLLVGELGYPHLHYSVRQAGTAVCAYAHSSDAARLVFEALALLPGSYLPDGNICYGEP
jgi:hypothetical protein